MEPIQITLLILQILLNIYGDNYNPDMDFFLLTEESRENIVFVGNFKKVKEIVICDNPLYDYCGLKNKQRIILLGQTQVLLQLDPHPFRIYEAFYIHTLNKKGKPTHPIGYKMWMGRFYDRIYPLI